jgi:hypothetical protein
VGVHFDFCLLEKSTYSHLAFFSLKQIRHGGKNVHRNGAMGFLGRCPGEMRCLAKIILFSQINNPSSFILF